ncbi:MAG: GMC oxidoreductase [Acidimicrobiales bacterium]
MSPLAVVVGSGASGGMVARLLAMSGQYQVVILDKGRSLFSGLGGPASSVTNNWANDEIAHEARSGLENQDLVLEPRSFRTQNSGLDREFVGDVNTLPTTVGGGTTHYDAKARRLREVDFVTNSLMKGYADPSQDPSPDTSAVSGANYANWPMEYKHLEAFYAVSEEVVGVQGPANGSLGKVSNPNPYESWRSTPYPMPPGVSQLNSLLASYAARSLGYSAPEVPTSVNSRPYRDGRPACNDCAFCLDFGCPINAKGGGVWQVNDAIAAGAQLIPNANVLSFDFGPTGNGRYVAKSVTFQWTDPGAGWYGPGAPGSGRTPYVTPVDGKNTIPVDLLVLANTPIEASRLSFYSAEVKNQPFPDPSGQLGKNLMFHLQTTALAVVDRDIHSWRGRTSSHTLDAFLGPGPSVEDYLANGGADVPRGGITELGGNQNPIQMATEVAAFMYGDRLKAYMQLAPFAKRLVAMTLQGEDMPQLANMVDLDPGIVDVYGVPVPRVTYSNHQYELEASAYYAPKLLAVLEAIGAPITRDANGNPIPNPYPGIHPVFAASINTVLPALPGGVGGLPVDQTLFSVSGQTPSSNPTPFTNVPASRHILGTHRMSLDQAHGPCDPFGRYWNFDNLYHAGGGLYVTAAGFNVTLTMWALAYWQAAAILTGVSNPDNANLYGNRNGVFGFIGDMDKTAKRLRAQIAVYDPTTMIGGFIATAGAAGYDNFVAGK